MLDQLLALTSARRGHFLLESGHHGELWLDVDRMFRRPGQLRPLVRALAERLAPHRMETVCGPLTGGAFVAQMVAEELNVDFVYANRAPRQANDRALFAFDYQIPEALADIVRGKRVAVVNDVINAGSAVRGALADLKRLGAQPLVLGTLLALGDAAAEIAGTEGIPLIALALAANQIWTPAECPLCAADVPLEDLVD